MSPSIDCLRLLKCIVPTFKSGIQVVFCGFPMNSCNDEYYTQVVIGPLMIHTVSLSYCTLIIGIRFLTFQIGH